jgi:hypothetical protein
MKAAYRPHERQLYRIDIHGKYIRDEAKESGMTLIK